MKKVSKRVITGKGVEMELTTGTVEDFFKRSRERAEKMDRREKLPAEHRVTFEDPVDLLRALSAERVRLINTVRLKPTAISGLATILKRDRKSVSRDVKLLESLGLLRTRDQSNPGHGTMKVVEPLAKKYHLAATI